MKALFLSLFLMLATATAAFAQTDACSDTDIWCPDAIKNTDLTGLVEDIDRSIVEYEESESASLNVITSFDYDRFSSYLADTSELIDTIFNTERNDNPHSFDLLYGITYQAEPLDFGSVINEDIRSLLRQYVDLMLNVSRSQSADASNGMLKADYDRMKRNISKLQTFLDSFYSEDNPIDMPQHSEAEASRRESGGTQ